jgi:hypothetical protein
LPSIDIVDNPPLFALVTQTSLLYPYVETALQLVAFQSSFYFCSICYAIANKANLFLPAQSLEISIKRRPIILNGSSTNGSRNMVQFSSSSTLNRNISSSATFETAKDLLDKQSNIYSGRTISLYG